MWTTENRPRYNRDKLRYPSDLTDEEWTLVEPQIPPAKHGGRHRTVVVREVVNGVMYVLSTGCQWRYLPKDLPPKSTVHDYLTRWNYDGTIERMHHALYVQCREATERQASPTACVIDSQSVKSAEKGEAGSSGCRVCSPRSAKSTCSVPARRIAPYHMGGRGTVTGTGGQCIAFKTEVATTPVYQPLAAVHPHRISEQAAMPKRYVIVDKPGGKLDHDDPTPKTVTCSGLPGTPYFVDEVTDAGPVFDGLIK